MLLHKKNPFKVDLADLRTLWDGRISIGSDRCRLRRVAEVMRD